MDTEETFDAHTPGGRDQMTSLLMGKYMQISYPIYQMIEISVMYISICHVCVYIYVNIGHLRLSLLTEMFQIEGERNLKRLPLK